MKALFAVIFLVFPGICAALSVECFGLAGGATRPERTFVFQASHDDKAGLVHTLGYQPNKSVLTTCTAVRSCVLDRDTNCLNVNNPTEIRCTIDQHANVTYRSIAYNKMARKDFENLKRVLTRQRHLFYGEIAQNKSPNATYQCKNGCNEQYPMYLHDVMLCHDHDVD